MTRRILATTLLIALAGMMFIQFRLLMAGVRLEKLRFDQRTEAALQAAADTLNLPGGLSQALIDRFQVSSRPAPKASALSDSIQAIITRELEHRGVHAGFSYAIREKYGQEVSLASQEFDRESFNFGQFSIQLGDRITAGCHCEQLLHLDTENLFGYLLGELYVLAIPSVLCLAIILLCLLFLVNILKKEQKLNLVKNDFINNLTHELKTPAFSISLSAKMAKESLAKGELAKSGKFMQLIETENEKLKNHIEKVLELASLENARFSLKRDSTDLHLLIESVLSEFAGTLESRNGKLEVLLQASCHRVKVDEAHFKNLLRNLLDNALKYSPGTPDIQLKTTSAGQRLTLSVSDRGIGINPMHSKQVFEKFFRAPSTDAERVKGFGLGLSYAWQVAMAHKARIWVEEREGGGSVFKVEMAVSE